MKITRAKALPGWQGAFISKAASAAWGEVPEWLKGTDCKSVGFAYAGSNPALSTNHLFSAFRIASQALDLRAIPTDCPPYRSASTRPKPRNLGVVLGVSDFRVGVVLLTDASIRKAKPKDKDYKLSDGGGMFLAVSTAGGKLWRLKYRIAGKEKLLSLGPYPAVSLADARAARDRAKDLLREGKDPAVAKKLNRLTVAKQTGETFEAVARQWFKINKGRWSTVHAGNVIRSLEVDIFPTLGSVPIREIEAPEVLALLRAVEDRGAKETARRIRQRIGEVFTFAIAEMKATNNPAAIIVSAMAPVTKGRFPAITDLDKARQVLRDVDATRGYAITKLAIRLLALTAVRPGVIAAAPWSELPPGCNVWVIPAARMKLRKHMKDDEARDHLVPLSKQAIETIEAARTITGGCPLVFPNTRHAHRPMSENAMGYMLNRAGYFQKHVPHGWRSTFSTIMNERYRGDRAIIDLMLAHVPENEVEGAYNRALYLDRRTELAQIWADLISEGLLPPLTLASLRRG